MKYILTLILTLAVALGSAAQTSRDIKASQKAIMDKEAVCNTGTEPFRDFIAKFNGDGAFLAQRTNIDKALEKKYAKVLQPGQLVASGPTERDGDDWYRKWSAIQPNTVFFDCGWVDSQIVYTLEFTRASANEPWFLTRLIEGN